MSDNNGDDTSDDLEGLSALYSLLGYVARELACLRAPCDDAEDAVASAQAAIRNHLASTKAQVVSVESADDPETLLN